LKAARRPFDPNPLRPRREASWQGERKGIYRDPRNNRRMREELLRFLVARGTLADPAAVDYLASLDDPVAQLNRVLEAWGDDRLILTLEDVRRVVGGGHRLVRARRPSPPSPVPAPESRAARPRAPSPGFPTETLARAADVAEDMRVVKDVTGRSTCQGVIEDFSRYFRHRFLTLSRLLQTRRELAGAVDIAKAKRLAREVRIVGMVASVRRTRNGHRLLDLEDETDVVSVLLPADPGFGSDWVVPDEVVGVVGTANDRGLVIAKQLVRPDVSSRRSWPGCSEDICAAFVSDIHVGSTTFLRERWDRLVAWLGDGDPVAQSVRYLVAVGDVVDGIGVYPRQEEELTIDDIYAQYEELAGLFAALPDHLRVVMLPGNHDAVRPAEPQPTFPPSVQKLFDSNVTFVGNPCTFDLHGIRVLAYHGRSMDDFVSSIPEMSYGRPLDAMREMLRMRHLAPIYGGKTPIAPEAEDYLVVDDVPHIFATGHVHAVGMDEYRGVRLINSSTWQGQTTYQKMRNITPVPAQLPIIHLPTGRAMLREF
jgi:DNA polymerase II small subunit